MYIYDNIVLNSFWNKKCFRLVVEKIKTHFTFSNFFSESHAVCDIMWKNMVARQDTDNNRAQKICDLHAGYVRKNKHTHS